MLSQSQENSEILNTNEYIESGNLELYVLGKLTPAQEAEVQQYAARYPDIKAELNRIEIAFEQYALARGIAPPPGTLAGILRKTGLAGGSVTASATGGVSAGWLFFLAALTLAGLIGTYYGFSRQKSCETELAEKTDQIANLLAVQTNDKEHIAQLQSTVDVLRYTDYSNFVMKAVGKYENTSALAVVYYNETEGKAYFDTAVLPPLPTGKQYQLWALPESGPTDMGVYDLTLPEGEFLKEVPFVPGANAFAITVEDAGGVESPTMSEMIVYGEKA